jgi:hypothetical protein
MLPDLSSLTLSEELSTNQLTDYQQTQVAEKEKEEYRRLADQEWSKSSAYRFRDAQKLEEWFIYFENILRTNYEKWTEITRLNLSKQPETTPVVWRREWDKFLYDVRRELIKTFASKIIYPNNVGKPLFYGSNKPYVTYPAVYFSGQDGPNGTLYNIMKPTSQSRINDRLSRFLFDKLRDPQENTGLQLTPWPASEIRNTIFVDGSNALFEEQGCRDPSKPNSQGSLPAFPEPQPFHPNWNGRGSVFVFMKKDSFDSCVQTTNPVDGVIEYTPNFLKYLSYMTQDVDREGNNLYNVVILVVDFRKCEQGYARACIQTSKSEDKKSTTRCSLKSNGGDATAYSHFFCEFDDNLLLYFYRRLAGYNSVTAIATRDSALSEKAMIMNGLQSKRLDGGMNPAVVKKQIEDFGNIILPGISFGLSLEMYKIFVPPA